VISPTVFLTALYIIVYIRKKRGLYILYILYVEYTVCINYIHTIMLYNSIHNKNIYNNLVYILYV